MHDDPSRARRRPQVTVIGNYDAGPKAQEAATRVGELLGRLGCTVITGGGGGIMQAVCRGARSAGAPTIGILPGNDLHAGNAWLDFVIPSGIGYARNMTNVLAADLVISIGGASGTLNEIAFAWMHGKPIVALKGYGGWSDELAGKPVDERRSDVVGRADSVEDLEVMVRERLAALGLPLAES